MFHRAQIWLSITFCLGLAAIGIAADATKSSTREGVPLTRDDMKRALDASKESVPRLPLPPVTPEEEKLIAEQKQQAAQGEAPRRYGLANNGRMRAFYLPEYGFVRTRDIERARTNTNQNQDSSFDPTFRTSLFWIVSRGNNCTYCLGHQESGLANRGMTDDQLAALDGDWSEFDPARQAAFKFASKLSFEPYAITDKDVDALRAHYTEPQVVEIINAVAGFNSTNRWTGPLRIKQDVLFQFTRPTSPSFATKVTRVAPTAAPAGEKGMAAPKSRQRPALESSQEVAKALDAARQRSPRVKLADESATRELLSEQLAGQAPQQWMQLLATMPKSAAEKVTSFQAVFDKGTLDPRSKAIIMYVGARNDRAWYALGHAIARLKKLGFSDEQIAALDQPEKLASQADRELVQFARQITVDPALIDDEDFARMRKLMDDKKVAEVVYVTTQAAFFDRLTEGAGLKLEQ